MEVGGQPHDPAASTTRERLGTHCTGGWVDPKAGMDWQKISSPPDSIPDRPARSSVAIPTELRGPQA